MNPNSESSDDNRKPTGENGDSKNDNGGTSDDNRESEPTVNPDDQLDFGSTSIEGPPPAELGPIGQSAWINADLDSAAIRPNSEKITHQDWHSRPIEFQGQSAGESKGRKELPPLPFEIDQEESGSEIGFGNETASRFLINNATSAEASKAERSAQRPIELNRGLKRPPRFGVFLWWPAEGTDWVHPEDVETIDDWIPSNRVFKCQDMQPEEIAQDQLAGDFAKLSYGTLILRIRPVLWLEIDAHGYEIGDQVEIRSKMGKSKPLIGNLSEIRWNRDSKEIEYTIGCRGRSAPRSFTVDEFQPAFKLDAHLTPRQLRLIEQSKFR